jgi:hypothetical protein
MSVWNEISAAINSDPTTFEDADAVTENFLFISTYFQKNNFLKPLIRFIIIINAGIFVVIFQTRIQRIQIPIFRIIHLYLIVNIFPLY